MDWHNRTISDYLKEVEYEESKLGACEEQAERDMDLFDPLFDKYVEYLYNNVYQDEDPDGRYTVWPSYQEFMDQQEEE